MTMGMDIPNASRAGMFATLRWCPFWVFMLLFTLLLPTEFSFTVGALRLTAYRLVLIAAFFPCLGRLFSGRAGPISAVDGLMFLHLAWSYIVIAYHHGDSAALESGGIRMIEIGGAYLIARTCIVDEKSFRGAVSAVGTALILLAPFTVLESVTDIHFIKEVASKLMGQSFVSGIEGRLGLSRAFGPFDHPILLGVFGASALGISWLGSWPRLGLPKSRRLPVIAAAAVAASSLSSGALAALSIQAGLLLWKKKTEYVAARWKKLTGLLVATYVTVDLISNRSGYHVFLTYLTFSSWTAYNRIIIFQYGIQDVWRNPLFGIGFNPWTKPEWMHSNSMDNFWLVQAVTFGIPGFLTLALAFLVMLSRGWAVIPPRLTLLRLGWSISVIGMMVAACTVHFWNNLFVYFVFMLGAGAWFLNVRRSPPHGNHEETDDGSQ